MNRRWTVLIAVVALLAGCGRGGVGAPDSEGLDRMQQQARDALARYEDAVARSGGTPRFVPVGDMTTQIGDWEAANGDNNKLALLNGVVRGEGPLPEAPSATATVIWDDGTVATVPLAGAGDALAEIWRAGGGSCGDCRPLEATGARLTQARVATTRGQARVPVWEYTLKGTKVRITRIAVDSRAIVTVTPPSWDSMNPPGGLMIDYATTSVGSTSLTVGFTGSPERGDRPCGNDYSGQAVESANAVVVIVLTHPHAPGEMCPAIGAPRTTTVDLLRPLGERAVLEVVQGLPVSVTITAS
jgi:hypothetical protein